MTTAIRGASATTQVCVTVEQVQDEETYLQLVRELRSRLSLQIEASRRRRAATAESVSVSYVELASVSVGQDGKVDAFYRPCVIHAAALALVTLGWRLEPGPQA